MKNCTPKSSAVALTSVVISCETDEFRRLLTAAAVAEADPRDGAASSPLSRTVRWTQFLSTT